MPFDEAAGTRATGGLKGTLNKRVGPLPVWAWAGGVVGGIGVFLLFKHFQGTSTSTSASLPATSSQSTGPGALGGSGSSSLPDSSQTSGPATATTTNNTDILGAIGALGSQIAGLASSIAGIGTNAGGQVPNAPMPATGATLNPADAQAKASAIAAAINSGNWSLATQLGYTGAVPTASTGGSDLGSQPNTAATQQTTAAAPTGQQVATTTPAADPFAGFESIYTQQQAAGVNEAGAPNPYTAAAQAGY